MSFLRLCKRAGGIFSKIGGKTKTFFKNTYELTKTFGKTFISACKTYWNGEAGTSGFMKHAGKAWLLLTAALTIASTANVIYRAKQMGKLVNKNLIDKNQESTVI